VYQIYNDVKFENVFDEIELNILHLKSSYLKKYLFVRLNEMKFLSLCFMFH